MEIKVLLQEFLKKELLNRKMYLNFVTIALNVVYERIGSNR